MLPPHGTVRKPLGFCDPRGRPSPLRGLTCDELLSSLLVRTLCVSSYPFVMVPCSHSCRDQTVPRGELTNGQLLTQGGGQHMLMAAQRVGPVLPDLHIFQKKPEIWNETCTVPFSNIGS